MNSIRYVFSFNGRVNRARYWLATLIILCCMIFMLILLAVVAGISGLGSGLFSINLIVISASIQLVDDDPASKASWFPQVVTTPMTLVFAWAYVALSIRRLHDRNKSGWWIAAVAAAGIYGEFGDWLGDSWLATLIAFAVFAAFIGGVVEMYGVKGTRGPNRFGPDPLPKTQARPRSSQTGAPTSSGWVQQSELEFVPHSAGPSPASHVMRGHE
jgi:uncharacterized membrane protein YhaH (DUF805 family)